MRLLDERGDERDITLRSVAHAIGIAAPSIYPHAMAGPARLAHQRAVTRAFPRPDERSEGLALGAAP